MKKIIVICLALVMVLGASFSAFATPGGFYVSPSTKKAPELVEGKPQNEYCNARIVVTAYGDRDELSETARQALETAYASIVGTTNLNTLNSGLNDVAEKKGMDVSKFAVSDLFDISATDCTTEHGGHYGFNVTLKHEALQDFVALLHYNNGQWQIVENPIVTNNGEHLEFEVDTLSPFAVVVNTGDIMTEPVDDGLSTGAIVGIVAGSLAFLLILLVLLLTLIRKKRAEVV